MRFISRYDEDIMELYDEDPQDGTYYRGKESDEFYDPNAPFGYDRDERHEERKKHAALYITAHKELLQNADYLKAYNRILDEYAREYAYVILEKPITVVSDQERENERFILETFISDIMCFTACGDNKHSHTYSSEWSKDGNFHWQACSGCDEIRNKSEHDWNAGIVTTQPTETSEGVKTYTCNTCAQTKVESIPVLNLHEHTYSSEWSSNDTHHWHASTCEHSSEQSEYGEHVWNNGEVTSAPTTTSTGIKTYTCTTCSKTKTETIPKLEDGHVHNYDKQIASADYLKTAATCNDSAVYYYSCSCGHKGTNTFTDGEPNGHTYSSKWSSNDTHHWHASTCGHASEQSEYGEHAWNNGEVISNPTTTSTGIKTYTCTICSKTKTESIPKLENDHVHTYDQQIATEGYLKFEATCDNSAVYYYSCSCGLEGTATFEYGEPIGHTYSNSWSYNDTHHWHASTCGHAAEQNEYGEHTWNNGEVTSAPTTTSTGVKTYTCTTCSKTKTETIPKLEEEHVCVPRI